MDASIWSGVQTLLTEYACIGEGDVVILPYTSDSADSAAWVSAALQQRNVDFRRVWMAPLVDAGFKERLGKAVPAPADVSGRLIVLSFERDTLSHHEAIRDALRPFEASRKAIFRAINASADLFAKALQVSPAKISALNTAILERCLHATRLKITTRGGTDLRVTLDNAKHGWVSNRGSAKLGGTVVLPAGEVATFPATVEGVLVADFAFNVNALTSQDARLERHPVKVWVENRRAQRWACDDPETKRFIDQCFAMDCVHNVGELGLGTNAGVTQSIALNSHINERRPGVHLGFGQHNQDPRLVGYECRLHLDLIASGCLIWFDDDPVPMDLENLTPSTSAHPLSPRDEDAFSPDENDLALEDCCGVLTCDGLKLVDTNKELAELI